MSHNRIQFISQNEPHHKIEYDPAYTGGGYSGVGDFAYLAESFVAKMGSIQAAFEAQTGLSPVHIICTNDDERTDAQGNEWTAPFASSKAMTGRELMELLSRMPDDQLDKPLPVVVDGLAQVLNIQEAGYKSDSRYSGTEVHCDDESQSVPEEHDLILVAA